MKRISRPAIWAVLTFALAAAAIGQAPDGEGPPPGGPGPENRGQILRDLGLSREQAQQIRRINQERRPALESANRRVREANRLLDQAIYADQVDEALVTSRIAEVKAAQSEATSLRFEKELAIRRVLNADQLVRFREIRQRFEQMRQNFNPRRRQREDANRRLPADQTRPAAARQFVKQGNRRPVN